MKKIIIESGRGKTANRATNSRQLAMLEKGQIWKMGETYLEISETGKTLVHYKMTKKLLQRGLRKHMASILTVQAFLESNRAELLAKP